MNKLFATAVAGALALGAAATPANASWLSQLFHHHHDAPAPVYVPVPVPPPPPYGYGWHRHDHDHWRR